MPLGDTGFGDWVGTLTVKGATVKVGRAAADVTTDEEQALSVYSFAVNVKKPLVAAAVTEVPVKVAEPPDTKTQLPAGALKVAPEGRLEAVSCT